MRDAARGQGAGGDLMNAECPMSKVLIVEDDPIVLLGCQQAMQLAGIEVITAPSAEAAKTVIEAGFAGVVVTDIACRAWTGCNSCIWRAGCDAEMPVIMITGHGDVTLAVEAMRERRL